MSNYEYNPYSEELERQSNSSKSFATDINFTADNHNSISWTNGVIVLSEGNFKSIDGGNYTPINGNTYIYYDGTKTLKFTTDVKIAQSKNNIVIGTCTDVPVGKKAMFKINGNAGIGVYIDGDNIKANSITVNELNFTPVTPGSGENYVDKDGVLHKITDIKDGVVTETKLANGAVTSNKIVDNAIVSTHITGGAITTPKIATNAITSNKIAANSITGNKIVANSIISDHIATNAIVTDKIASNAIIGDKIAANTISADKIKTNEISIGVWKDAGALAQKDNIGSGDVTFNYASSNSKGGRYNLWLRNGDLSSGTNPSSGVIFDSGGIRGYKSNTKTFEINTSGDAYFRGNIYAESGTFTGNITSSATITGGTLIGGTIKTSNSGTRVELSTDNFLRYYKDFGDGSKNIINIGYGDSGDDKNLLYLEVKTNDQNGNKGPIIGVVSEREAGLFRGILGATDYSEPLMLLERGHLLNDGTINYGNGQVLECINEDSTHTTASFYNMAGSGQALYAYGKTTLMGDVKIEEELSSNASTLVIKNKVLFDENIIYLGSMYMKGNGDKLYLKYSNTRFRVDNNGDLYWSNGNTETKLN